MASAGIPERVTRLIAEHIHSIEQLEVLLLARRGGQREWTAEDVARELTTVPDSAATRLEDLAARGFLVVDAGPEPRYRYDPRDGERDRAVGELAEAYARRRVTVTSLIFSKPSENIRTFADAFRIRKEE